MEVHPQRLGTVADGIATYEVPSSKKDKNYHVAVDLVNGGVDCDCEDYECRKRPAFKALHQTDEGPTIGDLSAHCKHINLCIADCIKRGEINFSTTERKQMNDQEHADQNQEVVRNTINLLASQLSGEHVAQRQGGRGMMLDYLPAHYVIEQLNVIFDFDWDSEIVGIKTINERVYQCIVKLTVRYGGRTTTKQDVGIGRVQGNLITDDELEKCLKEAASDALKRAARQLGNQFGNSLYNKDQSQRYDAGPDAVTGHAQPPIPQVAPRYQSVVAQPSQVTQQPQQGQFAPPDPNKLRVMVIPDGEDPSKCRDCGGAVWWVTNPKSGKKMPCNGDGTIHFDTCANKTNDPALTKHNNTAIGSNPEGSEPMRSNASDGINQAQADMLISKAIMAYGEDGYLPELEGMMIGYFCEDIYALTKVQAKEILDKINAAIHEAEMGMR